MVEYERDFLDVIQRFSRTFGATFGFGHYHYEDFARTYEELGSFTDRLWPINLFSEEGGGPGVVSGVERFARLSGERWKCAPLSDTRAILSFEPIDVRPEMIPARWRQMLLEEWSDELPP
ncbi:MAG: hypothetical protein GWN18_02700 [Thermoplasmata archaeon]|nr:hypothetical protein [Thermoplasmata archaeon]NIS13713.1 hypothetical protein [Thermoplasmata archaeon]NIS18854.1 hypothetical protein [Thermoplasmata archaeon]NIT75882.1 hypothetical protein [Thermoplasmata archaeon]NIU48009.1 hypothetical protein [Thermoplasmata archaeon]